MNPKTARVDFNARGAWEIVLSDQRETVLCGTLGEASREARRCATDRRPCELIVRDAPLLPGRAGSPPATEHSIWQTRAPGSAVRSVVA
jgi:hypothetical protein